MTAAPVERCGMQAAELWQLILTKLDDDKQICIWPNGHIAILYDVGATYYECNSLDELGEFLQAHEDAWWRE